MPWKETSMESIRLNFIHAANERQCSFLELCEAFGISCKTGYKWLKRYNEEGVSGLTDRSRRPLTRPRDTHLDLESAIIAVRLRFPRWGPRKILAALSRDFPEADWPTKTTVANILRRNGYTTKQSRRLKLAATAPFEECNAPNEVWSADFKGWWRTLNGQICQPFTVLDTDTRFLFYCGHSESTSIRHIKPVLEELFQEYGMPQRFRTDNGPPFASLSVGRLSRLAIWLIKLGITPEWITPGKPQENGRHERMHRTLKAEAARPPAENLQEQERRLMKFQHEYNFLRPHEALGDKTPESLYSGSSRKWTGDLCYPIYPDEYDLRKVDHKGQVHWQGTRFFTSEMLHGETLGIKKTFGVIEVFFGPILLGRIDPIRGFQKV